VPQNEQTSQEQNDSDGTSQTKRRRLEKFEGEHTKIRRNELFSHSF
jgi:hypothetical protein